MNGKHGRQGGILNGSSFCLKKSLVFQFAQSTCACTGTASATATVAVTRQLIGFMIASRGLSRPLAGPDKLVHLVGLGEVVARLGRGFADRLDRAAQAADDFTYGNQIAALTLHGLFSHLPQTAPKRSSRKESRLTTIRHGGPCALQIEMRSVERGPKTVAFRVTNAPTGCYSLRGGGCNTMFGLGLPRLHSSICLISLWLSALKRPARFGRGRKAGT